MDNRIQAVFDYIDAHEAHMIQLWRELTCMESPTANPAAVNQVISHLDSYCAGMGMDRKIYEFEGSGSTFAASTAPGRLRPIALLGHVDTVQPIGSFGADPFCVKGDTVYGPGVLDMKGGVVIELFAIRALQSIGYTDRQIRMIISGDEEIAHSLSRGGSGEVMGKEAEGCAAVFNCETCRPDAEVILRRKGAGNIKVRVYGKAAHTGRNPQDGASAIWQAAQMIHRIESASDFSAASYNCGKIVGGKSVNVVPDYCEFDVCLRFVTNEQYEGCCKLIGQLCENPFVAGTRCEMTVVGFYPAMEITPGTYELLGIYQQAAALLGECAPQGVSTGGSSDSAFTTRLGIPTLCGIGVCGAESHAPGEHAFIPTLTTQCKKLAASILMLPESF